MERKKVYLGGKITGCPNYKETFDRYRKYLEDKYNYIVLVPHELPEGMKPKDYMMVCFQMINLCEEIFFIPNWDDSKGAKVEHAYCKYIGMPIHYLQGLEVIEFYSHTPFSEMVKLVETEEWQGV